MKSKRVLVLAGDGINCERETAVAFKTVGFDPRIVHINDLVSDGVTQEQLCEHFGVLALPGGFSFGDDLSSGKILAVKIKYGLRWNLPQFAEKGGLVLGICNGFQALIRLGVFGEDVSITHNEQGKFVNRWVTLQANALRSVWLKGISKIDLPIRHGEGRIVISPNRRVEVVSKWKRLHLDCLLYDEQVNGSEENVAGLCDPTGRILGLMPHPEAFIRWTSYPDWTFQRDRAGTPGEGLQLFENAYREAQR